LNTVEPSSVRNRLLAALPLETLANLLPLMRRVEMPLRRVLLKPNEPVATVYFPEAGWVSLLAVLEDGTAAEVGLAGVEGMVGLPPLFGTDRSATEAVVQGPGVALALDADALRHAMGKAPTLRGLLLRYAFAFHAQVSTTAACNVRHPLGQRLARWLLASHDRAGDNEFPITHEFLSLMLGVRRSGVTVAVGVLRAGGLIHYRQGHIRILDRRGLEAAACTCHRAVGREYDRLLRPAGDRQAG